MGVTEIRIACPEWVPSLVDWTVPYATADERMGLAIALSRENVARSKGGPFGAAVFERDTGRLVGVGVNLVVPLNNCVLHGEVVAIMMAQQQRGTYTLSQPGQPVHELVSSCEPCAMCLGATLWSGVKRLSWGATRDDAKNLHFDEGPVFPASYTYLEERGVEIVRGVRRDDAKAVLDAYGRQGGVIYNG